MSELKSYTLTRDGIVYRLRLSEREAARRGAVPVKKQEPENKQAEPRNKARKAHTKSED